MLTEKRQEEILRLLSLKGSVTVQELKEYFDASESTIRRDLNTLDEKGALVKVFGGAMLAESNLATKDEQVSQRKELYQDEKQQIGKYAASLIEPHDFVYLDAGTTTAMMLDYLLDDSVTYVTDGVAHAQRLVKKGMKVILLGGELKASTEAVIGTQAVQMLINYHFTKGFFGTNGITKKTGFTTPDINEAAVKSMAMEQCKECYIVTDASKFDLISPVSFSTFYGGTILTDQIVSGYEGMQHIVKVP